MPGTHHSGPIVSRRGFRIGTKEANTEVISNDLELRNIVSIEAGEMSVKEIKNRGHFYIFDDFLYQTLVEADTPWILNEGTDGSAADPVVNAQSFGVARFVGGGGDGSIAQDASQMVCHIPMKLEDVGTLVVEARLKFVTGITNGRLFVGLTDTTNREIPFSIATATVTSVATDAAGLLYDDGATAKTWHALSVANDVDSAQNVNTAIAPAITYQTLRIEAEEGEVRCFIDGVLVQTITNNTPRINQDLHATVCLSTTGTTRSMDLDYLYVGHERE